MPELLCPGVLLAAAAAMWLLLAAAWAAAAAAAAAGAEHKYELVNGLGGHIPGLTLVTGVFLCVWQSVNGLGGHILGLLWLHVSFSFFFRGRVWQGGTKISGQLVSDDAANAGTGETLQPCHQSCLAGWRQRRVRSADGIQRPSEQRYAM